MSELSEIVACTLSDTTRKSQRERWVDLLENFGIGRNETAAGLRLAFTDHPAVATELEALVALENHCCSWAAWAVERDDDGALVLTVRSQGAGVAVLHGMFAASTTNSADPAAPSPTPPPNPAASTV